MNFSYWEHKEWFSNVDFTIVGSGIVGLSCALHLKEKHPTANILILEKGILPQGASTKNAGFACFGSLSEIVEDLQKHTKQEVFDLIKKRWEGLQLLRKTLGDTTIDFQQNGGYELFNDETTLTTCLKHKEQVNKLLFPLFEKKTFNIVNDKFKFKKTNSQLIFNQFEGQIDTGKMMIALLQKVLKCGIKFLNNTTVLRFSEDQNKVHVETTIQSFITKKLYIATNGFAKQLLNEKVEPARAQVLITKPIKNLHIKGTFHLDKGYYYFRNINNRILFGGGRNLDFKAENTTEFGKTTLVQQKLNELLTTTILPDIPFQVERTWSGIMGVGNQKKAIVKQLSNHVFCGVRLGGMGIAIGSIVGKELAELN